MPTPPKVKYEITAEDKTARAFRSVSRNIGNVTVAVGKLGVAVAAAGAGAFVKLTTAAAKQADEINKLSTQLGISTEALSEYQFVASQTGVRFEQFTLGIQRATRRIAEAANGTGEAKDAIRELGLSAQDLVQLSPDKAFEELARAINRVTDPAVQLRLAFKLFDTEGVKLLRTIKGTNAEFGELREEARRLGVSLDQDAADKASDLVDAFDRLSTAVDGVGNKFLDLSGDKITAGLDAITAGVVRTTNAFDTFLQLIGRADADQVGSSLTGEAQQLGIAVSETVREIAALEDRLERLRDQQSRGTGRGRNRGQAAGVARDIEETEAALARLNARQLELSEQLNAALRRQKDETEATATVISTAAGGGEDAAPAVLSKDDAAAFAAIQKEITTDAERLAEKIRVVNEAYKVGQVTLAESQEIVRRIGEGFAAPALDPWEEWARILEETKTPAEELAEKILIINTIVAQQPELADAANEAIRRLGEAYSKSARESRKAEEELTQWEKVQKEAGETTKQFGEDLVTSFADGTADAGDLFKTFVTDLIQEAFRLLVVKTILDSIFPGSGSAAGGIGSLFGRAIGGPVRAGQPVLVGEQGPELFVPNTAGQVEAGGAMTANVNISVTSLDGSKAADVLVENRSVIVGIIRDGFNRGGVTPRLV